MKQYSRKLISSKLFLNIKVEIIQKINYLNISNPIVFTLLPFSNEMLKGKIVFFCSEERQSI